MGKASSHSVEGNIGNKKAKETTTIVVIVGGIGKEKRQKYLTGKQTFHKA